ncbi:MAG: cytochrome c [Bacteroidales bacterium]|nr:cytochrome c [Bacteroidales bacterium]
MARLLSLITISLLVLLIGSCDRTRMDKGYEYFPDMAHGPAYKTYSENPAMADGKTMRKPVEGTIPTHIMPYAYPADAYGREAAGKELRNPHKITERLLEEGESLYQIFCANCHGRTGDGMGNLFTSGAYVIPPTSLVSDEVKSLPEGELYHVITAGWGVMGPHASLIRPDDRWKIVSFIQEIVQAQ